jgi:hypothetical protein
MQRPWLWLLALGLAACSPAGGGGPGDDDDSPGDDEAIVCHGDALSDDVAIDDDIDNLRQRWDANKELLRILFVGEPL